jgi:hypothetical protein
MGLPLGIIVRSIAVAPAETMLQEAVVYRSELAATKERTRHNL